MFNILFNKKEFDIKYSFIRDEIISRLLEKNWFVTTFEFSRVCLIPCRYNNHTIICDDDTFANFATFCRSRINMIVCFFQGV